MANELNIETICDDIKKRYSPCDVSDALLKLKVPGAGYLRDISPIPSRSPGQDRVVAPISTVLFVPKDQTPVFPLWAQGPAWESNIAKDKHWTDYPTPGTIVVMQQPPEQSVALLGDIVATRLKHRSLLGAVIDGRARDVVSCSELCKDGSFQVWSKALSSVGTSMEAKPWAVDVPVTIGGIKVSPGDILCADEGESVICVIPKDKLQEVANLLPKLKKADDGVLADVQKGVDFLTALKNYPDHYSNK